SQEEGRGAAGRGEKPPDSSSDLHAGRVRCGRNVPPQPSSPSPSPPVGAASAATHASASRAFTENAPTPPRTTAARGRGCSQGIVVGPGFRRVAAEAAPTGAGGRREGG